MLRLSLEGRRAGKDDYASVRDVSELGDLKSRAFAEHRTQQDHLERHQWFMEQSAGGGWGGTHGEAARPAHHLPAPAPQRTPQARASASRCVLGAILMILWLAATGYLVHLM